MQNSELIPRESRVIGVVREANIRPTPDPHPRRCSNCEAFRRRGKRSGWCTRPMDRYVIDTKSREPVEPKMIVRSYWVCEQFRMKGES